MVIIITTLVGFALRLHFQYSRPGFLLGVTEYDDGPYFGSAVRLVHGSMPYRQFVLVQPPGITLLMSPAALLSYWTGTAWGLAIGRILTLLAGTAGVALAGLLVRHRGLLAVLVTCGITAVYSDAVAAAHTVLVEPWLVLFCLAGALAVFDRDRITTSTKRLAWGGVLFGFAGAVEAWAIVPVIVLAALCLPRLKRAAIYAGGVAAGFLIPVLPFALAGPRQFYHSLITAQVGYRAHAARVGVLSRLRDMIGFPFDGPECGRQSAEWLLDVGVDLASFFIVTPLPGTEDHDKAVREGTIADWDFNNYDSQHMVSHHPRMTTQQVVAAYRDAVRTFYSPRRTLQALLSYPRRRDLSPLARDAMLRQRLYYFYSHSAGRHPMLGGLWQRRVAPGARRAVVTDEEARAHYLGAGIVTAEGVRVELSA